MTHLLQHQLFWIAIVASVSLAVAVGALIDRLYTGRRRYARLTVTRRKGVAR